MTILVFACGLAVLVAGAELLVRAAARLAAVFGVSPLMIVLNLFIGIILNSMSETHAEIEQARPARASPELADLAAKVEELQEIVQRLRSADAEHNQRTE